MTQRLLKTIRYLVNLSDHHMTHTRENIDFPLVEYFLSIIFVLRYVKENHRFVSLNSDEIVHRK